MKKFFTLFLSLFIAGLTCFSAPFTVGNIVVVRVGDGNGSLSSVATAVFLDEYTTAGILVQSIPLPTADNGTNQMLTVSGSATSEGAINLSTNRQFITIVGYDAALGTTGVASTSSATVARVVGVVDASGNINTTTALTDAYSANNIRSAVTADGTSVWVSGATGGVRYAATGATTSTVISSTPSNVRIVSIYNNQLYSSSSTTNYYGVSTVGSGTPTTTGQATTILPGFPTATGPSTYGFDIKPGAGDVAYVADDRTTSGGGIQKWTLSGGTWTLAYSIIPATNLGARGVTVDWQATTPIIYATATNGSVYKIMDGGSLATSTSALLITAATNTAIRGVAFTPGTIILPLQLLSFSAAPQGNSLLFSWKTASEHNTSHFDVEQSSDGIAFKAIATVAATGNSTVEKSYSYTGTLIKTTAYYRLKMVDADGKFTTSSVVKFSPVVNGFSLGNVYPVPAKNSVTIEWNSNRAGAATATLTDVSGRTIRTVATQSVQGFNRLLLDVQSLTAGQYFLRLQGDANQVQTIITKQ